MEEIYELNNGDDCTTILTINDSDGIPVINDMETNLDIDFEIWYYTVQDFVYKASRVDGVCSSNCSVEGNNINVYIDHFCWGKKARAYVRVFLAWPDSNFPDGKKKISSKPTYSKLKIV